ncbi:protein suppressor of sable [Phlebotomus argentipes]|uniref:protein suppressor of sable n=1 Tax=Phlebotomus argentipes TaxID=94469 RepID=UPI0028931306|nr:protein suppressor of sable [Phlebotomus argentipes]
MDSEREKEELDLEDGEIESDGDDEPEKAKEEAKEVKEAKKEPETKPEKRPAEDVKGVTDEWAVKVEKAIANVLKKDGIEVAEPRVAPGPSKRPRNEVEDPKPTRRRKRKREEPRPERSERPEPKRKGAKEEDEYEMLCIRGGSPPRREYEGDSDQSFSSYSSYDSGDYRRPRKRQQRERRRGGGPKHYDKRRQHDSDTESRHQRKLELCKFYLMDCCAKREKCLYMHSDFPCKYYYLGLNCINRETCKFSHGRPLTNQLRGVLLKHLETAPKEILGDFPRLGREHATHMLNATHKKLLAEFEEGTPKQPRKSRWCGDARKKPETKEDVLSLRHLTNVLSQEQIDRMATMGIETLDQVQHLTFMQLTELGLSFQQLSEIQLNTKNFVKLGLAMGPEEGEKAEGTAEKAPAEVDKAEDTDMRVIDAAEIVSPDREETPAIEPARKEIVVMDFGAQSPEEGEPESKLLIDETWYSDDEARKSSDNEWPPAPPVVEAADVTRVVGGSLSKIDYSSQILPEAATPERDPRKRPEIASPDAKQRPSIYDPVGEEVAENQDQDMRLLVEGSMRDVDLRLPFKPLMTNYVPATEIDASLASHAPMHYKVFECLIPPPDYREIRKRMPAQGNTQDPRLRRILSLREPETAEEPEEPPKAPSPRQDPRRKREDVPKSAPAGGIDIQQVLQKSPWYKDLGSKNKIMVNQQLAVLSAELKRFAADPNPGKVFDLSVVAHNPTLQHILAQLGICLSESGQFTMVEEGGQRMIEWMAPRLPGFMPPNRPGLLGVAPMPPFDAFYGGGMPDFFNQPPPGDMPRPRPPFRGRPGGWAGGRPRRHFDAQRQGRRDKSTKN